MKSRIVVIAALLFLAKASQAQTQQGPPQSPLDRLRTNIEQIANSVDTTWGIYIRCLETNEEVAVNADRVMDTMSVIKVPLMVEAFRQIEAGHLSLADRYTVSTADKRPGTGILRSLDDGASLTLKDLLTLMIIVSDNTATDAIFQKVGGTGPVNALMRSYGLNTILATGSTDAWFKAFAAASSPAAFHRQGQTPFGLSSPRDMGRLLERIARGQAVSKRASDQMIDILNGQVYRTRIPKYVVGFQTPHKTGDFVPFIVNDVGLFISGQRKVVISIFTEKSNLSEGRPVTLVGPPIEDAIARIAEHVANYFAYRSP